jgi:RNA polymerase sigma factor (sigma-70 family)
MELSRPLESPADATAVAVSQPDGGPPSWDWDALDAAIRPRLVAFGMRRFRLRREECEDALQGVFVNVLAQEGRVRDPIAYIKVAFLNACRSLLASRGRVETEFGEDVADASVLATRIEAACAVAGAFRQIEPRCRELIRAYYIEDLPLAETADRNGYSHKTVWKRINRCLEKMRLCLR